MGESARFDPLGEQAANAVGIDGHFLVELGRRCSGDRSFPDGLDERLVRLVFDGRCLAPRRFQDGVVRHERRSPLELVVSPHAFHDEGHDVEPSPFIFRGLNIGAAAEGEAAGRRLLEELIHGRFAPQHPGLTVGNPAFDEANRAHDALVAVEESEGPIGCDAVQALEHVRQTEEFQVPG